MTTTTPQRRRARIWSPIWALAALAGAAAPALSQNALGDGSALRRDQQQAQDGRALDNSLSAQGRQNFQRPDLRQETAFRNAIVTGNAPGGLSFRGDVGYRAPGEFAAALGSDNTFGFRRDSYYSGLAGQGIRGTEALQYQFALTTGGRVPASFGGAGVGFTRDGGALSARPAGAPISAAAPGLDRPATRPGSTALSSPTPTDTGLGALRATSAYTANRGYQPLLLGSLGYDGGGEERVLSASPLRGVRVDSLPGLAPDPAGSTTSATGQSAPGVGAPGSTRVDLSQPNLRPPTTLDSSLGQPLPGSGRIDTAYDSVMQRLRDRAADLPQRPGAPSATESGAEPGATGVRTPGVDAPEGSTPWWQEQLERLREELSPNARPETRPSSATDDGSAEAAARAAEDADDERTARVLRLEGFDPVRELAGPGLEADDLFAVHMRSGQALLAAGRYFDAEERFTRALAVRGDDPSAQVGRLHAQLGASMFVSAALNIRGLFAQTPEMIGVRYASDLLPTAERRADLTRMLRENIGLIARPGVRRLAEPQLERDSGLLLAYLGWQAADARAVGEGLDSMERSVRASDPAGSPDAALLGLLRRVWVVPEPEDGPAPVEE